MGHAGAGAADPDELITDLSGLPPDVRHSMFVLRLCDRWKRFPGEVEQQPQDLMTYLEHEQLVRDALKRHTV